MRKLSVAFMLLSVAMALVLNQHVLSNTGNNSANNGEMASPVAFQNCFESDPAVGSTDRDAHYRWAQQQNPDALARNLSYKIGLLFNCSSVSGDQLANAFADISVIVANYISDPACFGGDTGVTGKQRAPHEQWARTKTREQVRDNLAWKMAKAMKCLSREQQNTFFADVSSVVANAPSSEGGEGRVKSNKCTVCSGNCASACQGVMVLLCVVSDGYQNSAGCRQCLNNCMK